MGRDNDRRDHSREPGLDDLHPGLNQAGAGITVGDWQIGVIPTTSTDSRHDLAQNEHAAERAEDDQREANKRGEHRPDPVGDLWKTQVLHQQPQTDPDPAKLDAVMSSIQEQIAAGSGGRRT